jgi:hypothetical protein
MIRSFFIGKILLTGSFLILINASCTDLEEDLFSEVTPEDFFKTDEQFTTAIASAYTRLGAWADDFPLELQNITTDEIVVPTRGTNWDDGGEWRRLTLHAWTSEHRTIQGAWNFGFQGVTTCNQLIYQFEELIKNGEIDVSTAESFIAELVVLRGFYYWFLLDTFGNIPYVTDFVNAEAAPGTVLRKIVYTNLVEELEDEVPKLSKAVDATTYGRMNYWAGKHLLAILYLNAEVYTGTLETPGIPEWHKAADAANEIIESGLFNLETDYFANFNVNSQNSSEFIFAIPYDAVYFPQFNLVARTLHYTNQSTYNLTFQPWNGHCVLEEFYHSYEDSDLRKGKPGTIEGPPTVRGNFIAGYQYAADGKTPLMVDNWENPDPDRVPPFPGDPDGPWINFGSIGSGQPMINELGPQAIIQAGVRIGKWEFEKGGTASMNNDHAIFRYAHTLLIRAEALWRLDPGSSEALALVNQVRTRANASQLISLDGILGFMVSEGGTPIPGGELLNELGRELFAEKFRRTDLIRWGYFTEVDKWVPPFNNPGDIIIYGDAASYTTLFPIPRNIDEANPNLIQNPGY